MSNSTPLNENSFFSKFLSVFLDVFDIGFDIGYVFLPLVGYIFQYLKFKKLRSTVGFSKFISLIFIISFILRVFFWFGKRFKVIILLQTVVGIIMHIILLKVCVEISSEYEYIKESDYFNLKEFWNWPNFYDYLYFIFFFIIFVNTISLSIGYDKIGYTESLGAISSFVETLSGLPQIIEIYNKKTAESFSYALLLSWILGDSSKLFFFIKFSAPIQLMIMAGAQFLMDIVIILQIIYYNRINKQNLVNNEENFENFH